MARLERFISFVEQLPPDQVAEVEEALDDIMAGYAEEDAFSSRERDEIDRRLQDPAPRYATPEEIARVLRRPLRG